MFFLIVYIVRLSERWNLRSDGVLQVRWIGTRRTLLPDYLHLALCVFFVAGWFTLTGCSTHAKRISTPRTLFYDGRLDECKAGLEKLAGARHDRDVVNLDLAIVDLLRGDPVEAEKRLKVARDRFDELESKSITENTLSMWTDEQVRSYAGEDYEKILIRAFLALSNLLHDGTDAESYTLQLQEKHEELVIRTAERSNRVKPDYQPLPMGFYMRGLLREATLRDYDDAIRNYEITTSLLPDCIPFQWDLHRARYGVHSNPGNGVLYVFALVGRGPYKVEVSEQPTSDALLIADRIVSAVGPYKLPPTIAPIKIPDVTVPISDVDSVRVSIEGQAIGPTQSIADIEKLAIDSYEANRSHVVARAVARRVIKKATVAAAKETLQTDGITSFGMDLAGIAWEATEGADTRCWGLLPRDIQVLRVEIPKGVAQVQLTPLRGGSPVGGAKRSQVSISDGRNTYLLCWFPDARSPGQVLSNPRL
jgi:hypothetical protein